MRGGGVRVGDGQPVVPSGEVSVVRGECGGGGGQWFEWDAECAVGGFDIDGAGAVGALGKGVSEEFEEEPEGVVRERGVRRGEFGKADAPGVDEAEARLFDLGGLFAGDFEEALFFGGAVYHGMRRAARGVLSVLAEARREPDGGGLEPAGAGGCRFAWRGRRGFRC